MNNIFAAFYIQALDILISSLKCHDIEVYLGSLSYILLAIRLSLLSVILHCAFPLSYLQSTEGLIFFLVGNRSERGTQFRNGGIVFRTLSSSSFLKEPPQILANQRGQIDCPKEYNSRFLSSWASSEAFTGRNWFGKSSLSLSFRELFIIYLKLFRFVGQMDF